MTNKPNKTLQLDQTKLLENINKLIEWDKNPRSIDKDGFERLKNQLQRVKDITGEYLYKPLLITPDNVVIGGNMRLRALRDLGVSDVWVNVVNVRNEQEMIEVALSDNDQAGKTEKDLLLELIEQYPEIKLTNYAVSFDTPTTLKDFMDQFKEVEEDEVPEVNEAETISKLGEVYQLGRHRLMCGDATKIDEVNKLMNGMLADCIVTDPPYNTGMQEKAKGDGSTRLSHMFNDKYTPEQFKQLLTDSLANMLMVTKGDAVFYISIDWRNVGLIKEELQKLMPVKNVIVWDKVVHGLGSDYKFTYEMIVVGKKGNPEIQNRIGTDYQDIWRVQRTMGRNDDHATAKPIELLIKPIQHASKQDDIILDLFGGSGSTLIACEQTNRNCYMMELDPKYCDVIRKRYENFTKK